MIVNTTIAVQNQLVIVDLLTQIRAAVSSRLIGLITV